MLRLEKLKREQNFLQKQRWANNPIAYFEERLKMQMWDKLAEILESVRDNPTTLVYSANGIGKTHTGGGLPLWWLECFEPSIVLITGSSWATVKDTIFPRIRSAMRANQIFDKDPNKLSINLSDNHFLTARSTNNPENLAGLHSPNILQIVEESSGVEGEIFDALNGNATGNHSRQVRLGNPLRPSGRFYDDVRDKAGHVIQISAFDHPNVKEGREVITGAVTRENIVEYTRTLKCLPCAPHTTGAVHLHWLEQNAWFIPSPRFQSRVLGEFPSQGDDTMFNERLLRQASERTPDIQDSSESLGCDVARFGDDETVIAFAYKHGISKLDSYRGLPTTETAGIITKHCNSKALVGIGIDETGVGGGVVDVLRDNGIETLGLTFGAASIEPALYANLKTEMYFKFKEALEADNDFVLPDDEDLIRQAADIRYVFTPKGQFIIEPKDKHKKRTGSSPDKLEACIIAWYVYTFYEGSADAFSAYAIDNPDREKDTFSVYHDKNPMELYGLNHSS